MYINTNGWPKDKACSVLITIVIIIIIMIQYQLVIVLHSTMKTENLGIR